MNYIHSIEIRYFRSIYHLRLDDLPSVLVLSGRNDVGKSNILKALNLFFNNQTDWNRDLDFQMDFSKRRLNEVRSETIKGKQFIQISIIFNRGNRFLGSLPSRFRVTRTWYRDSSTPNQTDDLESRLKQGLIRTKNLGVARGSLQRFLNKLNYQYIPAIKDQQYFTYLLSLLQDVILERRLGQQSIEEVVSDFNSAIETRAEELHSEFRNVTGIDTHMSLPSQLGELFRAFTVATGRDEMEIPLSYRGDGIRSRFLPSLLYYVSRNSVHDYIWGFEEPENSMENALITSLSRDIAEAYSEDAQVFVTTHSPALFSIEKENVAVCRVYKDENNTEIQWVKGLSPKHKKKSIGIEHLEKELGLMKFQEEFQREYERRVEHLETERRMLEETRKEISKQNVPILLTEGKIDCLILEEAWKRLRGDKCPFRILKCGTSSDNSTTGGVHLLRQALESVRSDQPITVGLFDRDKEGYEKGFHGLAAHFCLLDGENDIKIHQHATSGAIVLSSIPGRELYADVLNLPIEFYFEDTHLDTRIDGKGLELFFPEVERTIARTGVKINREICADLHFRQINPDSKKPFAELVVPELPNEAFKDFEVIFQNVERTIEILTVNRAQAAKGGQ